MAVDKNILEKIKSTKPLSQSAQQILLISGQEDHSLMDIVRIVEHDNVLTANILKMANSAAFQPKHPIDSIQMAISLLGERWVVSAALETCASSFFNKPLEGYLSEKGELWQHSLVTAIGSRIVCQYSKTPLQASTAFTAGILHDIGKSIISSFMVGSTNDIINSIDRKESLSYIAAENKLLGTNHCEVGFTLATIWKLPTFYQDVILYHHNPDAAPEDSKAITYAVHLGDILSMMAGIGTGSDSLLYELNKNYTHFFNITAEKLPLLILEIDQEYEQIKQSLEDIKDQTK